MPLVTVNHQRFRAEMAARGLTWRVLGEEAGVPPSTLSRALGKGKVTRETFRRLREALYSHSVLPEDGLLEAGS